MTSHENRQLLNHIINDFTPHRNRQQVFLLSTRDTTSQHPRREKRKLII